MAAEQSTPKTFKINPNDYDLTVEAVRELGLQSTANYLIREYEQTANMFTEEAAKNIGALCLNGSPELTVHLPFIRGYGLKDLKGRFDRKRRYSTLVDEELWDQYSRAELNNFDLEPRLGVAINERVDPYNIYNGKANGFDEQGLIGTGRKIREFRIYEERIGSLSVGMLTVSQYIVMQTKRSIAGEPPLDRDTRTVLPQLFNAHPDRSIAPAIGWSGDRLELARMDPDYQGPDVGVRHVINLRNSMLVRPKGKISS